MLVVRTELIWLIIRSFRNIVNNYVFMVKVEYFSNRSENISESKIISS